MVSFFRKTTNLKFFTIYFTINWFSNKSCRYGISLAIEIENTKKVVKYSALGALAVGAVGNNNN